VNLHDIKAGDEIKVGVIVAWREWRYRLNPLRLLSLSFNRDWPLDCPMEGEPDGHHMGIFALKARPERWAWPYIESAGYQDGFVIGRVALWGVVWEHEYGWRAQYARPLSFIEARGIDSLRALQTLRDRFSCRRGS
jgi:hypothetical protein